MLSMLSDLLLLWLKDLDTQPAKQGEANVSVLLNLTISANSISDYVVLCFFFFAFAAQDVAAFHGASSLCYASFVYNRRK